MGSRALTKDEVVATLSFDRTLEPTKGGGRAGPRQPVELITRERRWRVQTHAGALSRLPRDHFYATPTFSLNRASCTSGQSTQEVRVDDDRSTIHTRKATMCGLANLRALFPIAIGATRSAVPVLDRNVPILWPSLAARAD